MQTTRSQIAGFTLIELMITVAVVGILAAIAYPSYQDSVRKSWRANGASCLMELAQRIERHYTASNPMSYEFEDADAIEDFLDSAGCTQESGMAARYGFSFAADPTATAFTLQAVPDGPQASDTCGTLTITQTGQKGPADKITECWRR